MPSAFQERPNRFDEFNIATLNDVKALELDHDMEVCHPFFELLVCIVYTLILLTQVDTIYTR